MENIIKDLNTITAHKHTIHKVVQSSKDISGLPISHDYAQYDKNLLSSFSFFNVLYNFNLISFFRDLKTLFIDAISFLNNIGDTNRKLDNIQGNSIEPSS